MSALGESALGQLALGEEPRATAVALSFDLFVDPDTFYDFVITAPVITVPPSILGGIIGIPPPVPPLRLRTDVTVKGIILTCKAILIPGRAETISLYSGNVQTDVVARTKRLRPVFLYLIPGEASGTIGISQEEIDALVQIFSEAA